MKVQSWQGALDLCGCAGLSLPLQSLGSETGRRPPRILLVDPDDAARSAMAASLGVLYEVIVAREGMEGLRAAESMHFDAIVAEVAMPGLDGISMIEQLRARKDDHIPVLFLLAEATPAALAAGHAAGATACLAKPVNMAWLAQEIGWMIAFGPEVAP